MRWTKEGAASVDDHVQVTYEDHGTMFFIPESNRNDSGKYTLHLDNSSGAIAVSCTVKVLDTPGPCQELTVILLNSSEIA